MSKVFTIILMTITVLALPWISFNLWEIIPYDYQINSLTFRNIIYVLTGSLMGLLFVKQRLKLRTLPFLLVLFIGSNILWSIQRFNHYRQDMINNAIDYPLGLPECEKESNYEDIWDYMQNGCHYSTEDFFRTILNRVLVLTISILVSRILYILWKSRKRKRKDAQVLDQ